MRCGEAGKYGGGATGCTAPLMHCSLALQAATLVAIHASFAAAVRNCSAFAIGGVQLDFRSGPPHDTRSRPLQSCRAMSAYTCCTQRDDAAVVAAQRAFLLDGGGATPCARLASAVLCAACHGEVGTRALKGVDPTLCDSWCAFLHRPARGPRPGDPLASPSAHPPTAWPVRSVCHPRLPPARLRSPGSLRAATTGSPTRRAPTSCDPASTATSYALAFATLCPGAEWKRRGEATAGLGPRRRRG